MMGYFIGIVLFLVSLQILMTIIANAFSIVSFIVRFALMNLHISIPFTLLIISFVNFGFVHTMTLLFIIVAVLVIISVILYNVFKKSSHKPGYIAPMLALGRAVTPQSTERDSD